MATPSRVVGITFPEIVMTTVIAARPANQLESMAAACGGQSMGKGVY